MTDLERLVEALKKLGTGYKLPIASPNLDIVKEAARAYRDLVANGERVASYRDTDGFVKLHGSTMLDERGPGVSYLVVPLDRNLDSGGQTQVSESKLADGERVEPDYGAAAGRIAKEYPNLPKREHEILTFAKAVVDAAVGGRLLVDPPKEEER